ncbi:MAG: hypothetical protein AAGE94_25865, partial [Acidobacteriota bacterium]
AAVCASNLMAEASCCCPVEGPPPCFDGADSSDLPLPDSEGVVDPAPTLAVDAQTADATAALSWPQRTRLVVTDADPASSTAPAARLLACVWLC